MPFINLDTGIRMHYRDSGNGPALLFIPGLAATLDSWNYQVLGLKDRFRCICVDMRGHGDSDKPCSDYDYDEMCKDVRAFVAALDLRGVTLVGWSMGAGVGLKYVADFNEEGRVARLAMIGPATPRFLASETETFGADPAMAKATLEGMRLALPETMAAFATVNFHRTDMQATADWFLSLWLKMPAFVGYAYFGTLLEEDLRDRLEYVNVPVLICHGRHDQVAPAEWSEYMLPRIPDCRLLWFEHSGHALMVEEPEALSQALAKFAGY